MACPFYLGLEVALGDKVVELGHLHLRRVLGRVGAENGARVGEEDEAKILEVALQQVVQLLLPHGEVVQVGELEALPHGEPLLVLLERLKG